MEQHAVAKRLFTIVDSTEIDERKRVKRICLCGRDIPHDVMDCQYSHPGTAFWNALNDAEEGDEIEVMLPARTLRVTVQTIETTPALIPIAA